MRLTSLVKRRQLVGDKLELLLDETIELACSTKAMSVRSLDHVNVDITVQEKAVAFPIDAACVCALSERRRHCFTAELRARRQACRKLKTILGRA